MSKQPPANSMAMVIRRIRLSLGETQEEFAKRFSGASEADSRGHNAVYHWERGIQKNIPAEVSYWIFSNFTECDKCNGHGFTSKEQY